MKKLGVVTSTRAEYGLLSPVIKKLRGYESGALQVELLVTGTHLSSLYGKTIEEIDDRIDHIIPISVESDDENSISGNQAETLIKFTQLFISEKYDAVILLGDRYEILSVAIAAGNTRTPLFHLCGGDTTEGALDEWIRHSITKISYLHFVTNEVSRRRVIQLGENPSRVFNYGSTSIDNIMTLADMGKKEVLETLGLTNCRYGVCTYHPVTMENGCVEEKLKEFLGAIKAFPNIQFIVTKSNADQGGARINELLDEAEKNIMNIHVFASLGVKRYLSLMRYAEFVLGNSSSGIIEAPAFKVPSVNIGDRQKGRLQSESIINCGDKSKDIIAAVNKAMSEEHKRICRDTKCLYGDGMAAERIAKKIVEVIGSEKIDIKKTFYDIWDQ